MTGVVTQPPTETQRFTARYRPVSGLARSLSKTFGAIAFPCFAAQWPELIAPTLAHRCGGSDGIAGFDDLINFYTLLPNSDKQFSVMAGISHASFQQKNYQLVYYLLHNFFSQQILAP